MGHNAIGLLTIDLDQSAVNFFNQFYFWLHFGGFEYLTEDWSLIGIRWFVLVVSFAQVVVDIMLLDSGEFSHYNIYDIIYPMFRTTYVFYQYTTM